MHVGAGERWRVTDEFIEFDGQTIAVGQVAAIDTRTRLPQYELLGLALVVACTPSTLVGLAGESALYAVLMVMLATVGLYLRLGQRRRYCGLLYTTGAKPLVYTSTEGRDVAEFLLCAKRAATQNRAACNALDVRGRRFRRS